jgi:hypothetical protein
MSSRESGVVRSTYSASDIQNFTPEQIDAVFNGIANIADPADRRATRDALWNITEGIVAQVDTVLIRLAQDIEQDEIAWRTQYQTRNQLNDGYKELFKLAKQATKRRNLRIEATKKLEGLNKLSGKDWSRLVPAEASISEQRLRYVAVLAKKAAEKKLTPEDVILIINRMAFNRMTLRRSGRGGTVVREISSVDITQTTGLVQNLTLNDLREFIERNGLTQEDLVGHNLFLADSGFIEALPGVPTIALDPALATALSAPRTDQSLVPILPRSSMGPNNQSEASVPTNQKRARSASPAQPQNNADDDDDAPARAATPEGHRPKRQKKQVNYRDSNNSDSGRSQRSADELHEAYGEFAGDDDADFQPEEPQPEVDIDDAVEEDNNPEPKDGEEKKCTCDKAVTLTFKTRVSSGGENKVGKILKKTIDRVNVAKEVETYYANKVTVCAKHIKNTATSIGLKTRLATNVLLTRILRIAKCRNNLGDLMVADDTYHWFNLMVRDHHPAEIRGVYKYDMVQNPATVEFKPDVDAIFDDLKNTYNMDVNAVFQNTGNVHVPIFNWWFTTVVKRGEDGKDITLADLALEEIDMYMFHYRRDAGNAGSLRWLCDCYYSGAQQLMRQDPEYYRLYVGLRPDYHWHLISYPYYMKMVIGDYRERTFFRHIDINITQALHDGRSINMIQGSVSLDDETDDSCTQILMPTHPDGKHFHLKETLKEWLDRATAHSGGDTKVLDGAVNKIDDKVFTKEDKEYFRADFVSVPCKKGEARITSPMLPHGSTNTPPERVRRTMLPWFVGIQNDHSAMEVLEMGTWAELSAAHRDLTQAPRSPSGKPNMYGGIPYSFPAAHALKLGYPISDALVGRTKWSMRDVEKERDLVLGNDVDKYREWLAYWRKNAVKKYVQMFEDVKNAEQEIYQEKSF